MHIGGYYNMAELIVPVKQGEELNLGFTVKENGEAMNLSPYNIHFQVKKVPLENAPSIIDKLITSDSEEEEVGVITDGPNGVFNVHLKQEDTSFPPGDYALVISIVGENYIDIISSKCCNKAIYRICEQ